MIEGMSPSSDVAKNCKIANVHSELERRAIIGGGDGGGGKGVLLCTGRPTPFLPLLLRMFGTITRHITFFFFSFSLRSELRMCTITSCFKHVHGKKTSSFFVSAFAVRLHRGGGRMVRR